jgi:hypothetical protein
VGIQNAQPVARGRYHVFKTSTTWTIPQNILQWATHHVPHFEGAVLAVGLLLLKFQLHLPEKNP